MLKKHKRETPASMTPQDVYSKLYRIAASILRDNNPCQIRLDEDGIASCSRTRKDPNYEGPARKGVLCCGGCEKLGPDGCTVDSLDCKLWVCDYIERTDSVTTVSMESLRSAARIGKIPASAWRSSNDVNWHDDAPSPYLQTAW